MKEKLKKEIDEYLNERVPEVINRNYGFSKIDTRTSEWKYEHLVDELLSGITPNFIFDDLVKEYQRRNELTVDGIIGPKTLMMLKIDIETRTRILSY